jgi:hypothetical protein
MTCPVARDRRSSIVIPPMAPPLRSTRPGPPFYHRAVLSRNPFPDREGPARVGNLTPSVSNRIHSARPRTDTWLGPWPSAGSSRTCCMRHAPGPTGHSPPSTATSTPACFDTSGPRNLARPRIWPPRCGSMSPRGSTDLREARMAFGGGSLRSRGAAFSTSVARRAGGEPTPFHSSDGRPYPGGRR